MTTTATWWSWFVWVSEPRRPGYLVDLLGFGSKFEAREFIRIAMDRYAGENYTVDGGIDTGYLIYDRILNTAREMHNGATMPAVDPSCPVAYLAPVPRPMLATSPFHPQETEPDAPVMDKRIPGFFHAPDFRGRRLAILLPGGRPAGGTHGTN